MGCPNKLNNSTDCISRIAPFDVPKLACLHSGVCQACKNCIQALINQKAKVCPMCGESIGEEDLRNALASLPWLEFN